MYVYDLILQFYLGNVNKFFYFIESLAIINNLIHYFLCNKTVNLFQMMLISFIFKYSNLIIRSHLYVFILNHKLSYHLLLSYTLLSSIQTISGKYF